MRHLFVLLLTLLTARFGAAQQPICSPKTETRYNALELKGTGFTNINPYGVGFSKSGGYWVGGLVSKSNGDVDFFLSKFNDTGKCLVSTAIGSNSSESGYPIPVCPTSDGGCLIAGRNNATYELASISKLDKNGALKWTLQSPAYRTGVYDAFRGIYVDNKNRILTVGTGIQLTGKANLLAALIDSNGNEIWLNNFDFGGSQHHFNAIDKTDSIYTLVGWCTFSGSISPIMAQISETGRFVRSSYYPAGNTTTFSDILVSPSKKIYTLGYATTVSGQHCFITCLKMDGTIIWQKAIGYGGDVGNKILMDNGELWVSGQSSNLGASKREYFLRLDTSGNLLQYGGLFWDVYSFSSKHQGWSMNRSHSGGLVAVGIDNQLAVPHYNLIFGNPCQTDNCGLNKIASPKIQSMTLSGQTLNCTKTDNGDLTKETLNEVSMTLSSVIKCQQKCNFDNQRKIPTVLSICNTGSDKVTANARNANYKYLWENGDTAASREFVKAGTYWVTTYNDCGSRKDTLTVLALEVPKKIKLSDTLYCYKGWTYLSNIAPLDQTTIVWENGDASWNRSISLPGMYWYEINNRCGIWRDTLVISEDMPPKSVLPDVVSGCNGKYVLLDGTQKGTGKYQYRWEDGYAGPSLWATNSRVKILKTSNVCGTIIDTVTVVFSDCECFFFIPNAFTPRSSTGKNDGWKPEFNCPMDGVYFSIYSRWGECLIRKQPISIPWDGYYLGDLVQEGVYVYIIEGVFDDPIKGGRQINRSGTLLVLDGSK